MKTVETKGPAKWRVIVIVKSAQEFEFGVHDDDDERGSS